ncbi:hypothetical protein YQE_03533, partial [Dendroctonus ponderosae]
MRQPNAPAHQPICAIEFELQRLDSTSVDVDKRTDCAAIFVRAGQQLDDTAPERIRQSSGDVRARPLQQRHQQREHKSLRGPASAHPSQNEQQQY